MTLKTLPQYEVRNMLRDIINRQPLGTAVTLTEVTLNKAYYTLVGVYVYTAIGYVLIGLYTIRGCAKRSLGFSLGPDKFVTRPDTLELHFKPQYNIQFYAMEATYV